MTLIDNWKQVLTKAWSVRWIVAAAILSGAEVALPLVQGSLEAANVIPTGALALLAAMVSGGALVARVLAQSETPLEQKKGEE